MTRAGTARSIALRATWALALATSVVAACIPTLDDLNDGTSCPRGRKACLGRCVPIDDPQFACASTTSCEACVFPNAQATCREGKCAIAICEPPFDDCDRDDRNGCETNEDTNVERCGTCNSSCTRGRTAPANGAHMCRLGVCGVSCSPDFGDCNRRIEDGCEVDLRTSLDHCGGCRLPCPSGQSCEASRCE